MKTQRHVSIAALLLGTLSLSARDPAPHPPQEDADVQEADYEIDADANVALKTVSGFIRARAWDKKTAHIKVVKRGKDRDQVEIRIDATRKRISIEPRYPEGRSGRLKVDVEIEASLPSTLKEITLASVSGDVTLEGTNAAESTMTTVSGSISLATIRGDLTASSVSGSVRISGLSGRRAILSSVSGTVDGAAQVESLTLSTISGSVAFDLTPKETAWSLHASSVSAPVKLRLPAGAGACVDLSTLSGPLSCSFPLKDEKTSGDIVGRKLRGTFGDGAGSIDVNTISGAVSIDPTK